MTDERIIILLSRRIAGELSPAEAEELQLALEKDPGLQDLLSAMEGVTGVEPGDIPAWEERQMLERGLRQWRQRASGGRVLTVAAQAPAGRAAEPRGDAHDGPRLPGAVRRARILRWSAAAAILVLAAVGVYQYKKDNKPQVQTTVTYHEVAAKFGTRSYVDLPDGSRLWLNAGSKVRYADGFATGTRELTLSGEAYFDIKHDPGQPFLIHAGGLDVRVLGTSLNVRAYPGDPVIETTLIQGKAEIDLPGKAESPIVLKPNEKVTMRTEAFADGAGNKTRTGPAADNTQAAETTYQRNRVTADPTYGTIVETSWVEDKLVFRKEPFRDVAVKLERWYNIRFHFENDKYQDELLTGYFKDQPIKNVMDGLQLSLGFHYEIAGDSILIK